MTLAGAGMSLQTEFPASAFSRNTEKRRSVRRFYFLIFKMSLAGRRGHGSGGGTLRFKSPAAG
jgi:hypothetical protein